MATQSIFLGIFLGLIFVIIGSQLLKYYLKIPAIYSSMIAGYVFAQTSIPFIGYIRLEELYPFINSFIAVIYYELGRRINIGWILSKKLFFLGFIGILSLLFLSFYYVLIYFGLDSRSAHLIAAILISTSPAFVLFTVKELHSEGYLTENIIHIIGISNILGLLLFSTFVDISNYSSLIALSFESISELIKFLFSAILGLSIALVLNRISNLLRFDSDTQFILISLFILSAFFFSIQFNLSPMITLLMLGLFTKIKNYRVNFHKSDLGIISNFSYLIIFIFAGYHLGNMTFVLEHLLIAIILILIKISIPIICMIPSYKINTLSLKKTSLVSLSLVSISSVAILLALDLNTFENETNTIAMSILWSVVFISELIGPALLYFSLKASREAR